MVLSFEDTPLFDWFKKNRVFILLMLVIIFGGNAYFYYAPSLSRQKNAESWSLYQTISSEIDLKENLSEKLALAEQDSLTYPWFVYAATRMALQASDQAALDILTPRLKTLSESEAGKSWVASNDDEVQPIASILYDAAVSADGGATSFNNPEPDGSSYTITLSDSAGITYDVTIGTYSGAAATAQHFIDNFEGIVGNSVTNFNNISLTIDNGLPEESQGLEVERARLFHSNGTLCTVATKERDGTQKPGAFQILLQDNYFADGQSTVFATITSGLEELVTAVASQEDGQVLTVTAVQEV